MLVTVTSHELTVYDGFILTLAPFISSLLYGQPESAVHFNSLPEARNKEHSEFEEMGTKERNICHMRTKRTEEVFFNQLLI